MTDNIVQYHDKLSDFQKVFLLHTINKYENAGIHLGSLPFVNRDLAIKCLRAVSPDTYPMESRKAKEILDKFKADINVATFDMDLDDKLVLRRSSGPAMINRVMMLASCKIVGAGIQWNAFKRAWVKPEKTVRNQAVLTRVSPGTWRIQVDTALAEYVKQNLFDTCGAGYMAVKSEVFQRANGSYEARPVNRKGNWKQRKW